MNDYKILMFKSNEAEIDCFCLNNDIWLSQKEIAKLYNKGRTTINNFLKSHENDERIRKMECVIKTNTTYLYDSKSVVFIGKYFDYETAEEFQKWVEINLQPSEEEQYKIVRFNQENIVIDVIVSPQENTTWLTQDQLTELFQTTRPNISKRIAKIYKDGELEERATINFLSTVQLEGGREVKRYVAHYNLDLVISLGFRINSKVAIEFRKWANKIIKSFFLRKEIPIHPSNLEITNSIVCLGSKINEINSRVQKLEEENQSRIIVDQVLFEDDVLEAMVVIDKIIKTSSKSIVLIDPYADIRTLNNLKGKSKESPLFLITSNKAKLSKIDIEEFEKKYGKLYLYIKDEYHDRYLIIDNRDFYHVGSSINYLGKRFSQISKICDKDIIEILKTRITKITH